MSRRRPPVCSVSKCDEPAFLGGMCRKHDEERTIREERRRAALAALHTATVENRLPDDLNLRAELFRLREWWFRACEAVQQQRSVGPLPFDEAEYAGEWCIALAQELVDAELALRSGRKPDSKLDYARLWVWKRFENLEAGLMSNCIPRPAQRRSTQA